MSTKETKTDGRYHIDFNWILFVPIVALLGIVPLITRLEVVDLDLQLQAVFGTSQMFDFFSQNKAACIMVIAAISIFIVFLTFDRSKVKLDKTLKVYYILGAIFFGMSLISTLVSEYKQVAMWGVADRAEGMIVIGAYLIIMFYTLYIVKSDKDMKYIIYPLIFLIIVTSILGYFQYTGEDLLLTRDWGKKLIVPEVYAQLRDQLTSSYEYGRIYGTMYHYNYMGSFTAMMIPLFLVLTIFISGWKTRIVYAVMTILSTFLLFGSTSRAGIIGLALSILVLIIVFARQMLKKWKVVVPIILVGVLLVVGLNIATKGKIFERIPTLINDAVELFIPSNDEFNYREHIPVKDIKIEGNTLLLQTQEDTLKVTVADGQITFTDQSDAPVMFGLSEDRYTTQDERFSKFSFKAADAGEELSRNFLLVSFDGKGLIVAEVNTPQGMYFVNRTTLEKMELEDAESIGFKGKEKLGSARGYIWSRSLPMMKDTFLLGYGPDTYPLEFPQNDLFGKWYAYNTPNMIVDKPHNLYLQIGINQGGIALLAFLGMMGVYIIDSLRLYMFKRSYSKVEIIGAALFGAIVGYLGAGIFNDSVVSVAPIFWVLLGCGIAINYTIRKERWLLQKLSRANKEHATIDMNTRQHR